MFAWSGSAGNAWVNRLVKRRPIGLVGVTGLIDDAASGEVTTLFYRRFATTDSLTRVGYAHERVRLLIDEGRNGPIDARPGVFAEMESLLQDPLLSATDRGGLLAAYAVLRQGDIEIGEFGKQMDQAIALLRSGGDAANETVRRELTAAIAVGAGAAAANNDSARCLELCLELVERSADDPDSLDARSRNNFGIALTYLGADDAAIDNYRIALDEGLRHNIDVMVAAASMNIAISVAQAALGRSLRDLDNHDELHSLLVDVQQHLLDIEQRGGAQMTTVCRAIRTHIWLLCDRNDRADETWGDLDATRLHPAEGFVQYFCGIEARVCAFRGDFERALLLVERNSGAETLLGFPKRDIESKLVESVVLEAMGDSAGALRAARVAVARSLDHSKSLPNLLINQLNRQAELESIRRALISRTNELVEQTMIDPLSGLGNRRALDAYADGLRDRPPSEIAVLVIDLDRFKDVNDSFGHAVGDRLIGETGAMLRRLCEQRDSLFRYGGDEFVVVIDVGDRRNRSRDLAERIRTEFSTTEWIGHGITCSIGLATGPSTSIEEVLRSADVALYEAKSAGRNRIESSHLRMA